jgi:RimJ/RimL family protein N-acetyltransferase
MSARRPSSILRTPRLLLRPPEPEDAAAIAARLNNRRIALNTSRVPWPYDLDDARAFIEHARTIDDRESIFVVLADREGLIGAIGVELQALGGVAEIGYWLAETFWNRGLTTESVRAVITHAFADKGHDRLVARCHLGNEASRRVLLAAGFRPTGAGLCHSVHHDRPVTCQTFELTSREWSRLQVHEFPRSLGFP